MYNRQFLLLFGYHLDKYFVSDFRTCHPSAFSFCAYFFSFCTDEVVAMPLYHVQLWACRRSVLKSSHVFPFSLAVCELPPNCSTEVFYSFIELTDNLDYFCACLTFGRKVLSELKVYFKWLVMFCAIQALFGVSFSAENSRYATDYSSRCDLWRQCYFWPLLME